MRITRIVCWPILSVLVLLGGRPLWAAIDFGSPASHPVGSSPLSLAFADFDGDGHPDLATANYGSGDVSVLLGNGDGTFQAAARFDAGMPNPAVLLAGDFNHDGKMDLLAFQPGNSNPANILPGSFSVLLGNGDGTFQAPLVTMVSSTSAAIVAADFNLDAKLDLAVAGSTSIDVFLSSGDGTFQAPKTTSEAVNGVLVTGDANGDGKPDLIVADGSDIGVFLGNGDGSFKPELRSAGTVADGFTIEQILALDVSGDGKLDLVVESEKRSQFCVSEVCTTYPSSERVSVFVGKNDGTFQAEQSVSSASSTVLSLSNIYGSQIIGPITAGDFNGDGMTDLTYRVNIYPHSPVAARVIETLLGRADGTFSPPVRTANTLPNNDSEDLNAGDVNRDSLADLISLDRHDNVVLIELNTSPKNGADLRVTGSANPLPAGIGLDLTFTADILNEGPDDASGVLFKDDLPASVTFVSASASQGSCANSGSVVTCTIGSLRSAHDVTASVIVRPAVVGSITNTMSVDGAEQDPALGNNTAVQVEEIAPLFKLTVTKSGGGTGSVTSTPAGIDCGTTCEADFVSSTSVSLTAAPTSESEFTGWSGACSGSSPTGCVVTLTAALSVNAGFAVRPDFSVSSSVSRLTVKRGEQASATLSFPAQGTFSGDIALTCSVTGPAPAPSCTISPSTVKPGGSATLTVSAPALTGAARPVRFPAGQVLSAGLLPIAGLILFAAGFSRRKPVRTLLLLTLVAISLGACGSTDTQMPPNQHFTVTVSATSGILQHSVPVDVTVQ